MSGPAYVIAYRVSHTWGPDPVEHAVPADAPTNDATSLCGMKELRVVEDPYATPVRPAFHGGCRRCERIIARAPDPREEEDDDGR